jgi:ubiquinone/menaquinone biosynthesis C-methylase UbiE
MNLSDIIYDSFMLPLETFVLKKKRKTMFKDIEGNILEIGAGTGTNLSFYDFDMISSYTVVDRRVSEKIRKFDFPKDKEIKFINSSVEFLCFEDDTFDSIVFTLVFCSVDDPLKGLNEVKRVLKSGGRIYFMEHVMPEHSILKNLFNRLNSSWNKLANGCNLNRETADMIRDAGFEIETLERFFGAFIVGRAIVKQ